MDIKVGSPKKNKSISSVDVVISLSIPLDEKVDIVSAVTQIKEIEKTLEKYGKNIQSEAYLNTEEVVLKVK